MLKNGTTTVPATVSYNPASQAVTLSPTGGRAYATTYTVTLSGAQDLYGNTISSVSWSFTTTSAPVTTAPTVVPQSPTAGSIDIATASSVSATFSAAVQSSTISFVLKNGSTSVPATLSYNPATQTAALTPTSTLAYATTYTATLSGAKDLYGNTVSPISWSFTTITAPSPSGPTIGARTPSSNATSVSLTANVTVTFSGDVQGSTVSVSLSNGSTSVPALVTFDPTTRTVTLNPTTNLAPSTLYTLTVSGAQDLAGDTMTSTSWSFTTEALSTAAPTVTTQTPVAGATGIAIGSAVSATFSEQVQASTISFSLASGTTSVPATVSYNPATQTVTLMPAANLAPSMVYVATLSGAKDLSGNLMATVSWSFTTEGIDATAPTVVAQSPAPAATNVAISTGLSVVFSKEVQASTLSFSLANGSTSIPATFSYNSATQTATLVPQAALVYQTTYTVTLTGGEDLSGNVMAPVTWSFTTASDTVPPTVTTQSPAPGATGVAVGSNVTATFNEAVLSGAISFTLANGTTPVAATFSYNAANETVTLIPTLSLAFSTTYTATLSGATDQFGLAMSPVSWSFTTAADTSAPSIVSETPSAGAVGVSTGAIATATFNKAVQPTTIVFTLKDSSGTVLGANTTYNAATNTAILTPVFPMALSSSYTATVSGAQDLLGDAMTSPFSWSFATADGQWSQSSVADFQGGTSSNTAVSATSSGGGQVTLAPAFSDDFAGTALDSNWTTTSWTPSGGGPTSVTVANNVVSVAGAEVVSTSMISSGGGVQGSVNFGAAPFQNFGMATDLANTTGNSWALFGTSATTDTLFAQVNQSGTVQSVNVGPLPSGFHTYLIQEVSGGVQFSVDGVAVTTIGLAIPSATPLSIAMSAFNGSPQPALQVDSVGVTNYASSGTYTSSTFDAGSSVAWGTANWTATLPAGTSITILTSSSTDGVNWSAWSGVTNGGTIASPNGRFFRYQVLFTTTDPTVTASLTGITFGWI